MQRHMVSIRSVLHVIVSVSFAGTVGCTSKVQEPAADKAPEAKASAPPCSFCPTTSPSECTLCVRKNPMLAVGSDGTASSILRICNKSNAPITPALYLSDFIGPPLGGDSFALPATSQISAVSAAEEPIVKGSAPLAPQQCIAVKVDATGLLQAGPMTSTLSNGEESLVELKAVRQQVPFNLKIDGPTPEKLGLTFVRGQKARIMLRNEDPIAYRFLWRLELESKVMSGEALALPNRVVEISVELDGSQFGFLESGFLRSGERQGRLLLQHEPDPSFRVLASVQRAYPVTAQLQFWPSALQQIWNAASILLVLLFGIAVSLLINYALPMQRKRVAVKQRLAEQDGRLGGIGSVISSRILNLLRVEKRRLREELQSLWPIDPATDVALPKLEVRVEVLGRRIELTASAGGTLKALEGEISLARHEIEYVEKLCYRALQVVEKAAPTEDDFKRAQAALDSAAVIRSARDEKPTTESVEELRVRGESARKGPTFSPAAPPEWKAFDDMLAGLRLEFLAADEKDPNRDRFVDAANAVSKAEAVLQFARLISTAGGEEVRTARLKFVEDLLNAIRPGPGESAAETLLLLRQVEQGVRGADLVSALESNKPGGLRIEVDPLTPRQYQLVLFRVHLSEPGMDSSAAREKIKWKWMVNGEEVRVGQDWTAWYFFERPGTVNSLKAWSERLCSKGETQPSTPFVVSAAAMNPVDPKKPIVTLDGVPVRLEATKSYVESNTMLSISSLVITVLLVGLGLLAGAQEKLQSLDWVSGLGAIVLLGFGADALKRAILKQ